MLSLSEAGYLIVFGFGVLLLLKRIADMERYYYLRLFGLITFLSFFVIYFFLRYGFPEQGCCVVPCEDIY